ncbi:MAG TPA: diguanylate cyclase [Candidatus Sulfotelmatobacter sp.]|jgi:diguanylate cyclase (GGDEF)-like protein/PAS domain S-box-containing protein|nr:diguanylate cyclase [Candidatus Sulfotelmatobacter sp.]
MSGWVAGHGEAAVRVLLVEDNPGDARLVRVLLTERNDRPYLVTHVSNLHEALALASGGAAFDVVLTDLGLPDSSGTDTVDALLGGWPDCPVVVLTGLADHETGIRAVQRGCQDYLVKGFDDPELLQRTIRYAIERSTVARELRESEERFRTLIEVSPEAILLCTDQAVAFANPAAVSTFGAGRRQDLLVMNPRRLFASDALDKVMEAVRGGLHKEPGDDPDRVECLLLRLDGQPFDAELTVATVSHRGRPAAEVIVRDITERKLAERQYRLTAAVFETIDEAMMVTDANNRIVTVNPAFQRVTGYDVSDVMGRNPHLLSSGRHSHKFYQDMWTQLLSMGHWHGEVWNRRKNGEVYVQRATLSLIRDAEGRIVNHVGVFSDVTDEKQEAERIRYRASYDALTGLPNRSLLHDRLQQALAKAVREQGMLAVLFLDLDGFKPVNDRLGHLAGDQLLMAVAQRLKDCVRESDTVARIGGDEFVIVLPDVAEVADAALVAGKVVQSLNDPFDLDGASATIGTSIGIALFPDHGVTAEQLVGAADQAMYVAKQTGKGRYVMAQAGA